MKITFNTIEKLDEAYKRSTANNHAFEKAVNSIECDCRYTADGCTVLEFENGDITIFSLDPFECTYSPYVMYASGFCVEIGAL